MSNYSSNTNRNENSFNPQYLDNTILNEIKQSQDVTSPVPIKRNNYQP